ncbi:MAG: PQQ-binding-like beta-propeller repeat protein [Planctomycetes bacterium]|nr:PQQ-binding-like beta-propeller repeat protein [Planctomycetota bacterium]
MHCLVGLVLWLGMSGTVWAAWPSYRHDDQRGGVSSEELKLPLTQVWRHRAAHAPRPAWPELPARQDVFRRVSQLAPTTAFDCAYHVAVADGAVYYGSSADDTVYCLDAAEGRVRWSFTTDGPVRLAPVVAGGRVYAGSDDGCLYCLDAGDGHLLWKYRGGPEDRRLPGNGRMMSLWPVRCGLVVADGVVCLCAGLFPSQGSYLCAVDADAGRELWKQKINVVSQGYMLASPTHLYVPTGRTAPHVFDRQTGRDIGALPGAGANSAAGGCFTILVDDLALYSAGEAGGLQAAAPQSKEKVVFADGRRVVADGPMSYVLTRDRLCAVDRAHWLELSRLRGKAKKTPAEEERIVALGGTRKDYVKWDTPCVDGEELILVGGTVFVGELDRVTAFDPRDGRMLWRGTVQGQARGLAVSDGRLYVSTDQGMIHCFQTGKPPASGPHTFEFLEAATPGAPYPGDSQSPSYERAVQAALQRVGTTKGYCLVLGAGNGRLAYEIACRSQFQVVGFERDAQLVAEARRRLAEAGLYGVRVTIHQGPAARLPFPSYWANLIVGEEALLEGHLPVSPAEIYRILRPCGGGLVLILPASVPQERVAKWGTSALAGWDFQRSSASLVASVTRGPLPGAGDWSHFYADPGNTACSGDTLAAGPVDLQWFGRPGPRVMPDRHDKSMAPLYHDGRLFVPGDNYIAAVDAYNGTVLWERDVPASLRLGAFKNCGSMAAADEHLYLASGSDCLALDGGSGQLRQSFHIPVAPDGTAREWGYMAVTNDLLLGSATRPEAAFRQQTIDTEVLIWRDFMPVVCSDSLFAHERDSGRRLWEYVPGRGVIINPTIALGGGRAHFIESTNPDTRRVADGRIKLPTLLGEGADLVALDLRTGGVLWRRPAGLETIEHVLFLSYARDRLVASGTKNVTTSGGRRVRYELAVFAADSGARLWGTTQTPIPDNILEGPHGEQVQHPAIVGDVIYGNGFACKLDTGTPIEGWKWQKSRYCGTLSTSANCAFSRYDNPWMFDLQTGQHTVLTTEARSGCWINILPAGGLILVPEASAGCTCGHPIQTSLAFVPRSPGPAGSSSPAE